MVTVDCTVPGGVVCVGWVVTVDCTGGLVGGW